MTTLPVIASTLSALAVGDFFKSRYNLNENFKCSLYRTGMNHTYFLSYKEEKYVIRVYSHKWRTKQEINAEFELLKHLSTNNISVSVPLADTNGVLLQELNAPEGKRYAALYTFAKGDKVRFMTNETCFTIGTIMGKFHAITANKNINRISYTKTSLLEQPLQYLSEHFSKELPEMKLLANIGTTFNNLEHPSVKKGTVHLDMWYDNMAVQNQKEITLFDFDFCGNGPQILDIGYFCNQLFNIETDKTDYERKKEHFLNGYTSENELTDNELTLLPQAGFEVFVFYLGVQAKRFDWSNIFLTENYLKMFVARMKNWATYNGLKV